MKKFSKRCSVARGAVIVEVSVSSGKLRYREASGRTKLGLHDLDHHADGTIKTRQLLLCMGVGIRRNKARMH